MKTRLRQSIISIAILAGGCSAGATVVKRDARGGQLALHGPAVPAAQQARRVMLDHCAGRYLAEEHGSQLSYTCVSHVVLAQVNR